MNELLAIIGTSWRPLLVFPGLLAVLILTLITSFLWKRTPDDTNDLTSSPGSWSVVRGPWSATAHLASVVLMLAFLPVPGSNWRYGLDVVAALALVEIPHWYELRRRLQAADTSIRGGSGQEIAALLNAYVLLGLAVAAVGQAESSLVLGELRAGSAPLWWAGIVVWAVALPPLLTLGPWSVTGADVVMTSVRRVAHIALLVTLALPASAGYPGLAIAALTGFGSLALLDHFWEGQSERWERAQPVIALALLILVLYTAGTAWNVRAH